MNHDTNRVTLWYQEAVAETVLDGRTGTVELDGHIVGDFIKLDDDLYFATVITDAETASIDGDEAEEAIYHIATQTYLTIATTVRAGPGEWLDRLTSTRATLIGSRNDLIDFFLKEGPI